MFEVSMLPASEGDCLLIRYGDPASPKRVLIDAGRKATFDRLLEFLPEGERHLELFVISHVDRDHIEGALQILGEQKAAFSFDDIWFNAYRHLEWAPDSEEFGAVQGERLTTLIVDRKLPWNVAFDGGPVRLDGDQPVVRMLDGGLRITILSPDAAKLARLEPQWKAECRRAGLDPSEALSEEAAPHEDPGLEDAVESFGGTLEDLADELTAEDSAVPNGSSIAFIAEFEGKAVFFGADAHPSLLVASLERLGRPLPVECALIKIPHHGSQANTTRALLDRLAGTHFFVSTNGTYFGHPDDVAIARILTTVTKDRKTLYFNYDQMKTRQWQESRSQRDRYRYDCIFPGHDSRPLSLIL
jgi:beta-lactamase superfamily II metal-dependent hydrolase